MKMLGYWAAQEQYSMRQLLDFVVEAEKAGFSNTMTSDHFHPWWHDNAFGNFTWVWISAAAERTKKMQFITGVTAPIYRYHPAIIAQAFASLDAMYPGRIGLGLGTGEAMNEAPLGFDWPKAKARLARTREAIQIIKELWAKGRSNDGFVDFNGEYFLLRQAKLYTPPASKIPLYMAATGQLAVRTAAKYSDGLITYLGADKASKALQTFNRAASESNDSARQKPKIAEYKVSFSPDYDRALKSTYFWRATLLPKIFDSDISDPRKLQQKATEEVSDEQLKASIEIVTSVEDCIGSIEKYFKVGFTNVFVHSTSPEEIKFVREFGRKVLPYFADKSKDEKLAAAA